LESITENIKTSAKDNVGYQKLKHNKPWFDDERSKLIDQRKEVGEVTVAAKCKRNEWR
jgi:hypothetical protein